jgi:NAD(P)-dependent dehydrogenase (short-subunit alcohol dehydrogenase family)
MPEDIGSVAALLASDDADYLTGCDIQVDGGFLRNLLQLLPGRPKGKE